MHNKEADVRQHSESKGKHTPLDTLEFERSMQAQGYRVIAGVDEAGRGPLAGPVVAAAVILPPALICPDLPTPRNSVPNGVRSCFMLSASRR